MGRFNIVRCYVLLLMCLQLWIVNMECHQGETEKKHSTKLNASHVADVDNSRNGDAAVNKRAAASATTHHHNHKNNNHKHNNKNDNNDKKTHHHKKKHNNDSDDIYDHQNISNGHNKNNNNNNNGGSGGKGYKRGRRRMHRRQHGGSGGEEQDIALWIEEQQLQMLSALFFPQSFSQGRLYIIEGGHVLNDIRDAAHIYKFLTIPSEVKYVNFTWKSGTRKYYYNFDNLQTFDDSILKAPTVSIKTKGRIPSEEKSFSVFLPCAGNASGTAMFTVGLSIENRRGMSLPGTPLRMNFKKECAHRGVYDSLDASNPSTLKKTLQGPDPACNINCGENGYCNHHKICQCKAGYTGQYCQTAFCFPQCLNGGNCTAPSVCTCPEGYQGTQCEGGICKEKCLNGGKCIQKDKCECSKGYYGLHCEFSKCVIPCMNGGRCIDTNRCRCPHGLYGNHCEIGRKLHGSTCKRPCKHGECMPNKTCKCHNGFYGRFCNGRTKKHRQVYR